MTVQLEHINITVTDAKGVAALLCDLFDWKIRWEGPSMDDGYTLHVGTDDRYVAVYSPGAGLSEPVRRYAHEGAMNHIGVVVADLDAHEARVREAGFEPHSHYDYEPGRRFYFMGPGEIEFELVEYEAAS